MKGIKGVFFDLHGTLLLSSDLAAAWEAWHEAFHKCMTDCGLAMSKEEFAQHTERLFDGPEPEIEHAEMSLFERRVKDLCGRLGLEVGILSKSKIRAGLEEGKYKNWDDPRLGTLRALRRRGLQPETIRELMIQVGPKPINATLSWAHIASVNRRNIESRANRYFLVGDPVNLRVSEIDGEYNVRLPLHPDHPFRGNRSYEVRPIKGHASFVISHDDFENLSSGRIVRLMGLFNVEVIKKVSAGIDAKFHSKDHQQARALKAQFIHWLPEKDGVQAEVVMPDAHILKGLAETGCSDLDVDDMIQFERFGFVRVDSVSPFVAYYAHR